MLLSFQHSDLQTPATWAGLSNYKELVKDPVFGESIRHTVVYTVLFVPITLVSSLLVAAALNRRLRGISLKDLSSSNFAGTFTFAGDRGPQLDANNQPVLDGAGQVVLVPLTSIERYRRTLLFQQQGLSSAQVRALGGGPTQFTIAGGNPEAGISQIDFGAFIQDDWRVRPDLTLSLGLRYEAQTNINTGLNFAPRIAFAWISSNVAPTA